MNEIEKKAKQIRRHTVVFDDIVGQQILAKAINGKETKAIAAQFGLSPSATQYRIAKAQKALGCRFRSDYRKDQGPLVASINKITEMHTIQLVRRKITPIFLPLKRK